MRILIIAIILMGCASARDKQITEYKEITKDICIDNPHEVKLAQELFTKMVIKR